MQSNFIIVMVVVCGCFQGAQILDFLYSKPLTAWQVISREFSQIENVGVCVNMDVEFHPVGCSTPQTLLNSVSSSTLNSMGMYEEKQKTNNPDKQNYHHVLLSS